MKTSKKTYEETIAPLSSKIEKEMDKIFSDFKKEKNSKKITSTQESNKLWDSKYQPKFNKLRTKHVKEAQQIWDKYFKR
jgi:hypothetical protein